MHQLLLNLKVKCRNLGGKLKNHVVVTPVRNESDFLPETIDSMVKQTIIPSQWIVVDDSSTDGTRGMLEEAEKEFKWIKLINNY